MKRPLLHVFIEAHYIDNEADTVHIMNAATQHMSFWTGHQLFSRLLVNDTEAIEVEQVGFSITAHGRSVLLAATSAVKKFAIDPQGVLNVKKQHVRLPFGLKLPGKAKARTRRPRKKTVTGKKAARPKQEREKQTSTSDSSSAPHSEVEVQAGSDTEVYEPATEQMEKEERTAKKLLKQHEEFKELVEREKILFQEVTSDPPANEVAASSSSKGPLEPPPSNKQTMKPKAVPKALSSSYFSAFLGLDEAALATTGRSECFYCKTKIPKQTVRFSWYHNTKRPSAWVHHGCLPYLVKRDGPLDQVLERLQLLGSKGSGSKDPVSEAVSVALASLQPGRG